MMLENIPTFESEWLETAFHKVILRRMQDGGGKPRDAMIACLALFVKAAIECGHSEQEALGMVHERFNCKNAIGDKHR